MKIESEIHENLPSFFEWQKIWPSHFQMLIIMPKFEFLHRQNVGEISLQQLHMKALKQRFYCQLHTQVNDVHVDAHYVILQTSTGHNYTR